VNARFVVAKQGDMRASTMASVCAAQNAPQRFSDTFQKLVQRKRGTGGHPMFEDVRFEEMVIEDLVDFCMDQFCCKEVCDALGCQDLCKEQDCPLYTLFDRVKERLG
jgi:hypothetical protein